MPFSRSDTKHSQQTSASQSSYVKRCHSWCCIWCTNPHQALSPSALFYLANTKSKTICVLPIIAPHTHTHTSQGLIKSPAKSEDLPDWLKPRGKKGENGNYFLLEILSVISRCLKEKKRKKKHHLNPKPNYFPSSYTIHLHRGLRSPHQGQENQNCHHDANR